MAAPCGTLDSRWVCPARDHRSDLTCQHGKQRAHRSDAPDTAAFAVNLADSGCYTPHRPGFYDGSGLVETILEQCSATALHFVHNRGIGFYVAHPVLESPEIVTIAKFSTGTTSAIRVS